MAKRGRPAYVNPSIVVNVKLYLIPGEDDDLIQWFTQIPPGMRARCVMAGLRGASLDTVVLEGLPDDDEVADLLGERLW